eukprot:5457705-Amphidinium_carterae.1
MRTRTKADARMATLSRAPRGDVATQAFYPQDSLWSWRKLTRDPRNRSGLHHYRRQECPWRTHKDTNHVHSGCVESITSSSPTWSEFDGTHPREDGQ